jgi:hypothetical protein
VETSSALACDAERPRIVSQNMRYLRTLNYCDQVCESVHRLKLGLLGVAARFQDFVERLDLPAHGVLIEFLYCLSSVIARQIDD